ncbi:MAG: 30S ribosomal protein S17 [Candidatus Omnitrophica bacterium]|nr:30S ribosomal protein S17 [Candidatus Omnitrophota bacterium]
MGRRKEFSGTVISDKMQKTVIVRIMRLMKHPKYKRIIKRYSKFKAHDENSAAKTGDRVRIVETRPISKNKRFRVAEILERAKSAPVELKEEKA